MTTEKIMANLLTIASELNKEDRDVFDFVRKNCLKKSTFIGAGARIGELYVSLEEQYRTETARKSGKSGVKRGMEFILKSAKKYQSYKEWLYYAYNDGEYQVACDCYIMAALSKEDHVPLAERPDRELYEWRMPNWKKHIPWECEVPSRLVELPDMSALKLYLKSEKLRRKKKYHKSITFDFGENLPCIKAEYLITAMEILPDAKAYYAGYENLCLLLINDSGSVVYVMGIEPDKNKERMRTEI